MKSTLATQSNKQLQVLQCKKIRVAIPWVEMSTILQQNFAYSVNLNLMFTNIRVSWIDGLIKPLHVSNFKMFLTLPELEWDF